MSLAGSCAGAGEDLETGVEVPGVEELVFNEVFEVSNELFESLLICMFQILQCDFLGIVHLLQPELLLLLGCPQSVLLEGLDLAKDFASNLYKAKYDFHFSMIPCTTVVFSSSGSMSLSL